MADTWRENAIVEAIEIIADKKIAQAGYDKTIKGVVNQVLDKTTGKYEIKYQDSLFEAYATNANINYVKNDVVSVLIPGNDWNRTKTILSGVSNYATTYQQVPVASQQYNQIGTNGVNLSQNIELSSYANQSIVIDSTDTTYGSLLNIADYIKKGDSIALGMVVRTALASSQQVNGIYGLTFNLKFADTTTTDDNDYIVRSFSVDTSDVIGNPYGLVSDTLVETLITGIDTQNFIGINSIEAFCTNFPEDQSKIDIKDIIISGISINGAAALTEEDLSGYVLHLNYSKKGNTLPQTGEPSQLEIVAQLKVNGKIISSDVKYYWFRQNGNIFRGDDRYSGFAGDGWECLNYFVNKTPVELTTPSYFFNRVADDFANSKALVNQRTNKILCVAVYKNEWIKGQTQIINMAARDIRIISSDLIDGQNKVEYYLNNGSPSFTCTVDGSQTPPSENYEYIWSFKPSKGKAQKIESSSTTSTDPYAAAQTAYQNQLDIVSKMAEDSANTYKTTSAYTIPVNNWNNNFKGKEYIYRNKYYNFPIKKIADQAVISCAVYNGQNYVGTGNIVLYNRQVLEGTYSLNILNGVQIFQYDEKGNSPFVSQIDRQAIQGEKPASLGFTLLDNTGQQISYEQIINSGYVKWLFPGYDTLLISNQGNPDILYNDPIATAADKALAANLYNIYNNKKTFSYSLVDQYKLSSVNNTIKLVIKYNDIIIESYTDLTFPKNGDPGTNGTDLVAKLTPSNLTSQINSDRVYAHRINNSNQGFYTDSGSFVDRFKFFVYNNNRQVYDTASFWSCPPKTTSSDKNKTNNNFITVNSSTGVLSLGSSSSTSWSDINTKKPIHIVRGKKTVTDGSYSVDYMAEYPVCYVYTNGEYRIKIKPKTGFKYIVYQEDGTKPDYDSQPFELVVEKRQTLSGTNVWTTNNVGTITATWGYTSGIKSITPDSDKSYIATVIPAQTFNGQDLTCAIGAVVSVDGNQIGFIHIPIYRLINKYGHNALNGWDGNSIQLNANGDTILAPQVGAGKKQNNNTFTGILMGDVKTDSATDTGLFGYDQGVRSIFLDAKTGNAYFGKAGQARINIGADDVGIAPRGSIYSSGYYNYTNGSPSSTAGAGMLIDLISPEIRFGSGHFSVDSSGNLTAKGGGTIAGWKISDTRLTSPNNNVYLSSNANDTYSIYANNTFSVTPGGYMTSTSGKIAKWNIDANNLTDGNVGMGQMTSNNYISANTFYNQGSQITNGRIWSNNNFVVDNNGKLWANTAQIGPWATTRERLTNGNVGLGNLVFRYASSGTHYNPFGESIAARFWGASNTLTISNNGVDDSSSSGISSLNFAVSNQGKLYSKAGKIGGWNITENRLYSNSGDNGINLYSNGNINSSNYNTTNRTGYSINWDGSAYFYNIDARNGKIGSCNINNSSISGGTSGGNNWYINSDGTASFNKITATGGTIGGMTITGTTVQGTGGWYITNSQAYFPGLKVDSSGVTSTSGGGITGGSGGSWTMPGTGAPSWTYDGKTMTPREIKTFEKLTLRRVGGAAGDNIRIITELKTVDLVDDITVTSTPHTISVPDGPSFTYYTYSITPVTHKYTVVDRYTLAGDSKIVTGWGESTKVQTVEVMCSEYNDNSADTT